MELLVIGGTQFVGRHIVERALATGHDVTLFHRGVTGDDLFPDTRHVHGDRNGDLAALSKGRWDATIDVCAYVPRHVDELADALDGRGGHYALISTISVYDDPPDPGFTEDAPVRRLDDPSTETIDGDTYGGLKALCETAAARRFGDCLIVRPSYVVGPFDHTGRFTWWVTRIAAGGEILAPGPPGDPMQVVDARDLADFTMGLVEREVSGVFHAATPPPPFSIEDLFDAIASEVAPAAHAFTWVDVDFLTRAGVDGSVIPLWTAHDPQRNVLAADASRALAAGLAPRPLAETVRDTYEWARTGDASAATDRFLTRDREAGLLARWHADN